MLLDEFPDNTKLVAWISKTDFIIEATGTAYSVAEIGEQFAWIGAALRSSPADSGVVYCKPRLEEIHTESSGSLTNIAVKAHIGVSIDFNFDSDVENDEEQPDKIQCQCWHDMFQNPVVVLGFPILRRPEPDTGLEISLNMMAGLIGTQRAHMFNGKLFIKGFASMLVPTQFSHGVILWHFLQQKGGSRISYTVDRGVHVNNVNISDLVDTRHIVGWSSRVKNYVGKSSSDSVPRISI
jgi:hypothetical protein